VTSISLTFGLTIVKGHCDELDSIEYGLALGKQPSQLNQENLWRLGGSRSLATG